MAVVYVLMYFKCKICFTVYTGETKINDTYLLTYLVNHMFNLIQSDANDPQWLMRR